MSSNLIDLPRPAPVRSKPKLSKALATALVLVTGGLWGPPGSDAAKTDVATLENGDVLTGEIKSLQRGKLTYKTDTMETVTIKWAQIVQLTSPAEYLITLDDATQLYGTFLSGADRRVLKVRSGIPTHDLPMDRVVRIEPIESRFLDRVELSVSMGYSYTQASQISQFTFDGRTAYKDREHFGEVSFNSIFTDDQTADFTTRQFDAVTKYRRTLTGRLFAGCGLGGQRNDELGLDLRLFGTVGAGVYLIEHSSNRLTVTAGLSVNRENYTGAESSTNNVEAVYSAAYSLFFYETPKTDLQLSLLAYDGLESTRVRAEFDASLNREVFPDFFVALTYYDNFDSDPPDAAESDRDRGVVFKLSWTK